MEQLQQLSTRPHKYGDGLYKALLKSVRAESLMRLKLLRFRVTIKEKVVKFLSGPPHRSPFLRTTVEHRDISEKHFPAIFNLMVLSRNYR